MTQFTTPTVRITLKSSEDIQTSLIDSSTIHVILQQTNAMQTAELVKDATSVNGVIETTLTQEETGKFGEGWVKLQVRGVTPQGFAWATNVVLKKLNEILEKEVLTYGS